MPSRVMTCCFLLVLLLAGCAGHSSRVPGFADAASRGDPQRRASMQLVLEGIGFDERGDTRHGLERYERALQVDSGNPYAQLALARHFIAGGDEARGLSHLDQARAMFEDAGSISPAIEAHLRGLRGMALRSQGREPDATLLLDYAARTAPDLWGDGKLEAGELR